MMLYAASLKRCPIAEQAPLTRQINVITFLHTEYSIFLLIFGFLKSTDQTSLVGLYTGGFIYSFFFFFEYIIGSPARLV